MFADILRLNADNEDVKMPILKITHSELTLNYLKM